MERYVIGYDIGRAINPMLVKGQIVGGFTQGLGGALMEEFCYSERGDPLSVTFADYLMPTARETPQVEIVLTEDYPTDLNPLGYQGRRRERHHRGRRGDRLRSRRRHRHARRHHRAADHAVSPQGHPGAAEVRSSQLTGRNAENLSPRAGRGRPSQRVRPLAGP